MFYGKFESQLDLCSGFGIEASLLDGCRILFAAYDDDGCYGGTALVVFRKHRKLYEVNGSHCSCYGLEDQWEPEETTVEALRHRLENGTLGSALGTYDKDFRTMLERLSRKRKPLAS